MRMLTISVVYVGLCVGVVWGEEWDPRMYSCTLCEQVLQLAKHNEGGVSRFLQESCLTTRICAALDSSMIMKIANADSEGSPYDVCVRVGLCETTEKYKQFLSSSVSPLQLRVAKAYGGRGNYNLVRVSVVTEAEDSQFAEDFEYASAFQYRWTNNFLYSSLYTLQAGNNVLQIGDVSVTVSLPAAGAGIRGVMIADPCISSRWVSCYYKDTFETYNRTAALLNVFMSDNTTSFYMIHGDNFYDKTGEITKAFYNQLTLTTQSKFVSVTAGNHDYWVGGSPLVATTDDQYGNGHMQWYAQDSAAALTNPLFDFSVNPDSSDNVEARLPVMDNFFWYNVLGNIGVMGYSGAYHYDDVKPRFEEACDFFVESAVSVAFLVGHWNIPGDGCTPNMAVPTAFAKLSNLDACSVLGSKLRYVMGHTHCNSVKQHGSGFMVAGQGMSGCGNYGVPLFDTTNGRFRILYFEVQDTNGLDQYDEIVTCVAANGIDGCTQYATMWVDEDLASLGGEQPPCDFSPY